MQLFQSCGTGGGAPGGVPGVKAGGMAFDERYVCPEKELFLDGMLGRLESAKTIRDRIAGAGFALANMQDVSGTLAEWIGQQIFDGNLESVCAALGRNGRF